MKNNLANQYFEWMYQLVHGNEEKLSYRRLLYQLHSTPFSYTIPMDANRAEDGVDLRYRFGYEHGIASSVIASCLNNRDCSVLEMMVALSIRCEEQIMDNPEIGDRTGKWFWDMIVNLGLEEMEDYSYDSSYTDRILRRFLNREYDRNGKGGLFGIHRGRIDMRSVEIWYQAMWYLDEILKN